MRVTRIEIIRTRVPYRDGGDGTPAGTSHVMTGFAQGKAMESLMLRVSTDTGHTGWGEAFGHHCNPATLAALTEMVAPYFLGATINGASPDNASDRLEQACRAFHLFGRTGPVMYALSGMDIALWDLKAQAAGQPLYALLGGGRRRLRAYASLVTYDGRADLAAANARQAYDAGFRAIKLHELEIDAIAAARAALPGDALLMTDVNCAWSPQEAARRAQAMRPLGLAWLEEPVWPPDDSEALAGLRRHGVPISAGENASGIEGYAHYLKAGSVDVIQPSVAKLGGVTAMRQAHALALRHGVRMQPHCYYYGPGLLATAHLIGALVPDALLEQPWVSFEALLTPHMQPAPELELPEQPGLGYEPDPMLLARYTVQSASVE